MRQTVRQRRCADSISITNLKTPGRLMSAATSRPAPVLETSRTAHVILRFPPSNIVAAFFTGRLGAFRLSSIEHHHGMPRVVATPRLGARCATSTRLRGNSDLYHEITSPSGAHSKRGHLSATLPRVGTKQTGCASRSSRLHSSPANLRVIAASSPKANACVATFLIKS